MSNDCNTPTRGRPTTKKALLIGISYPNGVESDGQTLDSIPTSLPNVRAFEKLLRESYDYTDITVMTDEDGVPEEYQPTGDNLERAMRALRLGVEPGDRRVIYYAGHSVQRPCRRDTEEDGQDEAIVAVDGTEIRDNTLHELLVEKLPKGSALTAIFDSCNSGTLLDLKHCHCNDVYRPWVNKGDRKSKTLQNRTVRKNCAISSCLPPSPRKRSGEMVDCYPSIQFVMDSPQQSTLSPEERSASSPQYSWPRTTSPERKYPCDGWCRKRPTSADHADVISISSSNDGQTSWDASTGKGGSISMTTHLINILKEHPEITTSELMTRLAHAVHSFTTKMHGRVQEERRARRKVEGHTDSEDAEPEEDLGEMDNFQDLQLGSITPLDMSRPFVL